MSFCHQCGATLPKSSKFCVRCGTKLQTIKHSPSKNTPKASPSKGESTSAVSEGSNKGLIIVFIIISIGMLLIYNSATQDQTKSNSEDYSKAYFGEFSCSNETDGIRLVESSSNHLKVYNPVTPRITLLQPSSVTNSLGIYLVNSEGWRLSVDQIKNTFNLHNKAFGDEYVCVKTR